MTAQQLKSSILQMAVQGKLVPQDPNDEPASVLLERIRAEKERLIREKKMKREKNSSVIFRGTDNIPYEKVGGIVRSLVDEVPFDIPDSWEWVRFGAVINLLSGTDFPPDQYNDVNKGIPYITGASNLTEHGVLVNRWTETPKVVANNGDILLVCKGSGYGKAVVCDVEQAHIARQIMAIKKSEFFNMLFIKVFLLANFDFLKSQGQGVIPGIDRGSVLNLLLPLPPLGEQHRIVAKIEKLLPVLEKYGEKESELSRLNSVFSEALKKSILQQAVQGKLVLQDPADEPVAVLLKRIRAEKQRLVQEGKIKKDKNESIIFRRDNSHYELVDGVERCIDEEIPFEIPESWVWDRIGNVFSLQAGKNIQASEIAETIFVGAFLCYGGNGIRGYVNRFNREGAYPIIGRQGALCGNINRATGRFYATEHAVCVETFCDIDVNWACLFLSALNLNQYATATAQPGLAVARINQVFIPIPPLSEQHRIVTKIEELLPLIQAI